MARKKLVVLTGAGVSAESGLKTFRDSDGLWEGYNVEEVATPTAWRLNPGLVLEFYNERRRNVLRAEPNAAHHGFAKLEPHFEVIIITQNIDDLHERAGSSFVLHLHGEIFKMRSEADPNHLYDIKGDIKLGDKALDGRQLRPHIVWFQEPVPLIEKAARLVSEADIFVIAGTSLAVYPAAGLLNYARSDVPKFILDKRIPMVSPIANLVCIEKPATAGILDLQSILLNGYL